MRGIQEQIFEIQFCGGGTISFKLNIRLCDSARHFFFFLAAAKETRSAGLRVALTAEAQTIETWNKDEGLMETPLERLYSSE